MPTSLVLYNYELDDSCYKVRLALVAARPRMAERPVDVFPGKEHLTPLTWR